jgi:hypothetical protein
MVTRIRDKWGCTIYITWQCQLRCFGCLSVRQHIRKPTHMSLEQIEQALQSLRGYRRCVLACGGEPTLHPQFPEVCRVFREYVPRRRAVLPTNGARYEQYKADIDATYGSVIYCDHREPMQHRPILVKGRDVLLEDEQVDRNIRNCYASALCTPAITERGAYFCGMAAGLDRVRIEAGLEGLSVPLWDGWWKRDEWFAQQASVLCQWCGLPHPLRSYPDNTQPTVVSRSWIDFVQRPYTVWDHETAQFERNNVPYARNRARNRVPGNWTRRSWFMFLCQKLTAARYFLTHRR